MPVASSAAGPTGAGGCDPGQLLTGLLGAPPQAPVPHPRVTGVEDDGRRRVSDPVRTRGPHARDLRAAGALGVDTWVSETQSPFAVQTDKQTGTVDAFL